MTAGPLPLKSPPGKSFLAISATVATDVEALVTVRPAPSRNTTKRLSVMGTICHRGAASRSNPCIL